MDNLIQYVVLFTRLTIALTFAIAFFKKLTSISTLQHTVSLLPLVPKPFINIVAIGVLVSEFLTVLLLLLSAVTLPLGFALALLELIIFTLVLAYILSQNESTSCNCFGASEQNISSFHLIRNASFILCAVLGFAGTFAVTSSSLTVIETSLVAFIAVVSAYTLIEFPEIARILHWTT